MFNFLDSKLTPKIACKSAAMDNYEVENLISSNYIEKSRGFIAYSAIKPPVEIEVTLICPVNIHYIVLKTTVGSQRCSGIEILAKTSLLDYTPICKSVYDKDGIIFCNSRKYSNNERPATNLDYHLAFFRSNTFKYFLNATALKVIIFRTEKSVPCLGTIEVWGIPSKSCSAVTAQTINYLMTKSEASNKSTQGVSDSNPDNFLIPEDFKDDLTYEIMSVPMTLPSGKTVDQSTLEKHVNSEISFGRKPCDPFTGIKFNDKIKPVLNVALKSRIDMFLLHNSDRKELCNVKRTVGRICSTTSTNIISNNIRKRKYNCEDDLDELIAKAKESPNFHEFSSENNKTYKCAGCGGEGLQALYGILCQHRYCRTCILGVSVKLKCSVCDVAFERSDVKKCNL